MESPILQGLNPAQRAAVEAYDSASLIIAGAGSGKTRVAHLAHRLYDPKRNQTQKYFGNDIYE